MQMLYANAWQLQKAREQMQGSDIRRRGGSRGGLLQFSWRTNLQTLCKRKPSQKAVKLRQKGIAESNVDSDRTHSYENTRTLRPQVFFEGFSEKLAF